MLCWRMAAFASSLSTSLEQCAVGPVSGPCSIQWTTPLTAAASMPASPTWPGLAMVHAWSAHNTVLRRDAYESSSPALLDGMRHLCSACREEARREEVSMCVHACMRVRACLHVRACVDATPGEAAQRSSMPASRRTTLLVQSAMTRRQASNASLWEASTNAGGGEHTSVGGRI